jgi:hypothetical protein
MSQVRAHSMGKSAPAAVEKQLKILGECIKWMHNPAIFAPLHWAGCMS